MRTCFTAAILIGLTMGALGCDHYMFGSHLSADGPAVVPIGGSFRLTFANACQGGGRYDPDNCASGGPTGLRVSVDSPGVLEVEELGDSQVMMRAVSSGTVTVTGTALLDGESHTAEHTLEIGPIASINGIRVGTVCGYVDVNGDKRIDMRFSADGYAFFPINRPDVTQYFETNNIVRIEPGGASSILVKGTGVEGVGVITSPGVSYEDEIDVVRLETLALDVEAVEDQEDMYRLNGSIGEKKLFCWGHEFETESLTPDVCELPRTWAPSQEIKVTWHLDSTCRVRLVDAKNNIDRTFELQR